MGMGNTYSLLVKMQAGVATMEIRMEIQERARNTSTTRPCYTMLGYLLVSAIIRSHNWFYYKI